MDARFATFSQDGGVRILAAAVNGLTVAELQFPPAYRQPAFEPDSPYLAVVLDGVVAKSFARQEIELGRACAVTMPRGATHGARFGEGGARIAIVKAKDAAASGAQGLGRLAELRRPELGWLALRLVAELRATDAAAPLAAEGVALELLAAAARDAAETRPTRRPPAWLRSAEELLRTRTQDCLRLAAVAGALGVHPTHLARCFRAHYGMSVGEYGRQLRLAWAAAEIARGDRPLAEIAAEAGFADQSHFTRLFRRHTGTTPARYRAFQSR